MYYRVKLQVEYMEDDEVKKVEEIVQALVDCGGLLGMRSGKTIINFDPEGNFSDIRMDYMPWKRRKRLTK